LFDGCHVRPRVKVEVAVPQRVFHVCVLPKSHYQSTPCQFWLGNTAGTGPLRLCQTLVSEFDSDTTLTRCGGEYSGRLNTKFKPLLTPKLRQSFKI
jgi:hypothetical protein